MLRLATFLAASTCLAAAQTAPQGASPGLINIKGISADSGASYLRGQTVPASPVDNSSFVRRVGADLQLGGQRYTYTGFNTYYALPKASDSRPLVTDALDLGQKLGMTVMRMWAFTEGVDSGSPPVQPQLGQLDPKRLSDLDWVVSEAQKRNIRLILTLANYHNDYGGFYDYVHWVNSSNASTVQQFYTDPALQAAYKDYCTAIILRTNTITGRLYRDDPGILAWDLVNEPANPGDESGSVLYDWLDKMSTYVKSIDGNHLVYYGTTGFFGRSTPDRLPLNINFTIDYTPWASVPWDPACQGEDWARNIALPNIDLASMHLYPAFSETMFEPATNAAQVQAHMQVAAAAKKPMVLDEFNHRRPSIPVRNSFLTQIFDLVDKPGSPVVGTNVWMLSSDGYADYDLTQVFGSLPATSRPPGAGPPLTTDWANLLARRAIFSNYYAADACVRARLQASNTYVSGWQDSLTLLSMNRSASS